MKGESPAHQIQYYSKAEDVDTVKALTQTIKQSLPSLDHFEFQGMAAPVISNEERMEMALAERTMKEETLNLEQKEMEWKP